MIKKFTPNKFNNSKKFNNGNDRRKNYTAEWKSYSFKFLHYNKQCYACGAESKCVDHIRSFRQGKDKEFFWMPSNHMPMCMSCHSYVTAKWDRDWTEEKYIEKLKWINKCREEKGLRFPIKVVPRD